jgi:hypothetical protein
MIETSKDLLFIILAFCILWLTIFLSWLLYYVISIVRDAESLVRQIKGAVEKVDHLAHTVREKFEHSAASFTLVATAVKELIIWAMQERNKKQVGRKKEKPAKE